MSEEQCAGHPTVWCLLSGRISEPDFYIAPCCVVWDIVLDSNHSLTKTSCNKYKEKKKKIFSIRNKCARHRRNKEKGYFWAEL